MIFLLFSFPVEVCGLSPLLSPRFWGVRRVEFDRDLPTPRSGRKTARKRHALRREFSIPRGFRGTGSFLVPPSTRPPIRPQEASDGVDRGVFRPGPLRVK